MRLKEARHQRIAQPSVHQGTEQKPDKTARQRGGKEQQAEQGGLSDLIATVRGQKSWAAIATSQPFGLID
jgi:hypothetical protein